MRSEKRRGKEEEANYKEVGGDCCICRHLWLRNRTYNPHRTITVTIDKLGDLTEALNFSSYNSS